AQKGSSEAARISRLVVPSQNTYSIILSDGTKVVLNANSELEFAETFSSANREVTLKGEGYFEVTKDPSKAFIVHANGVNVRVYGTKFNINGFEKENITTFLLEGSVSVSTDDSAPVRMKPMQVAKNNIVTKQQIVTNVTNADKYLSWMSNNFIFHATPVSEVVTMIENWYGIRFAELSKECRETLVSGGFSRSTKLGEMLIAIQNSINGKIYYENNQYHINLNQ
ncbi:MAG: FecR family protein, partial [Rikenellaceae bacterium]